MGRLRKFLRLSMPDQGFLIIAVLLVGAIRLGLWLLPFQTLRRLIAYFSHASIPPQDTNHPLQDRITWAVSLVSIQLPRIGTCLTQALATQVWLGRLGYPVRLRIGVARSSTGQLQAHAWLESNGKVVIGDLDDLSRYAVLPPLDGSDR